jgi:peptidoglycan hydrolase-like protein with peptidoglycan-binding domain
MFALSVRRRRNVVALAMLAVVVPAAVTLSAGPASAARPTCTTFTEIGGALLPATSKGNTSCKLQHGNRGDGVEQLQMTLVDCYKEAIVRDGIFGAKTEAALRRAQSSAGTTADGIYGPATRRAIKHPYLGDSPCGHVN